MKLAVLIKQEDMIMEFHALMILNVKIVCQVKDASFQNHITFIQLMNLQIFKEKKP